MGKFQAFVYAFGLATIFFGVICSLGYYLFFTNNIFKKLFYKIKDKTNVSNLIKELDNLVEK